MLREGMTQFTVQTYNISGQSLSRTVSTSAQRDRRGREHVFVVGTSSHRKCNLSNMT